MLAHFFWPVTVSYIQGVHNLNGQRNIPGWIISLPITAEQMIADRKLAKKFINKAVLLAQKRGARVIGLGALISPITNGGIDLKREHEVGFTTGNALTVGMTLKGITRVLALKNMRNEKLIFAVVGATGSIGQAVCQLLLRDRYTRHILAVGKTAAHLNELANKLSSAYKEVSISTFTDIKSVKNADIIIMATSSTEVLLSKDNLKNGVIIYDITQPQNVSLSLQEERKDVIVIDGGVVKLPENIKYNFNIGTPEGTTFACLAETMIVAAEGMEDFSLGKVRIEHVDKIMELAKRYNFQLAPLRSWGKIINEYDHKWNY